MDIENLHRDLPGALPAELGDKVQFFLRSNADQQMRFVIFLSQQINFEILKKALRLAIYAEPIFSYFYREIKNKAFWQKQELIDESSMIDLKEVSHDPEVEINSFLTLEISPFEFPIVRCRVIRKDQKDVVCINMNHTPTDGSGLKQFVKTLACLYTNLIRDPDYSIKCNNHGNRSLKQVTQTFSLYSKLGFIKEGFKSPKSTAAWSFDWNRSGTEINKHFITAKISSVTFDKIKAFGKSNNATINDVVLAAFIRSFGSNCINSQAAKPIIVPIDLRKYIKSDNYGMCSLTGSLICNVGSDLGNTFSDTLSKVREEMNHKKMVHAEMNMLSMVMVLSRLMSYTKLKELLMNHKMNPIPLITNVGIINPPDISFDDIPVDDSYITGAICFGDYFCMGYSTYQKVTTFSIGFTGGDLQCNKIREFLTSFKSELEYIA